MRRGAWAMLIVGLIASSAAAVDGVREINQVCASGPGCFSGDTAGFPVQITTRGSYRLTSNLAPPNQNTDVITINFVSGVSVDLNGFAIQGTNTYSGPGGSCTAAGTGDGVAFLGSGTEDTTVSNGHVRGMGANGIIIGANSRVERVTAFQNCGVGISVAFGSLVIDSLARLNFLNGILANDSSRVSNSVVNSNGGTGIAATTGSGRLIVDGCVSSSNGVDGINASNSLIRGNLALSDLDDGIETAGDSEVMENVANGSADRGLSVSARTGIGLNVATGNTTNLVGGVVIGCNLIGAAASCPP